MTASIVTMSVQQLALKRYALASLVADVRVHGLSTAVASVDRLGRFHKSDWRALVEFAKLAFLALLVI